MEVITRWREMCLLACADEFESGKISISGYFFLSLFED